jgi:NADH-quinone oxidoreductase subunit E
MAVRRLHSVQPATFAFTPENIAWTKATIAKYPPGKQASAVIPVLWRAQEQHAGWLPEPAIRLVADLLSMPYIRVFEIATFYTMFQLAPVGKKAHVQVCGTTPCMLRGAEDLKKVCQSRIHHDPHHLSDDGDFSWEEVECLGSCANAPMVQIWQDTYEDLTPASLGAVLDGFAKGAPPKPGSQTGRIASSPAGGMTALTDASLYDGSMVGAWKKRLADVDAKAAQAASAVVSAAPALAATAASAAPVASQAAPKPASPEPVAVVPGRTAAQPTSATAAPTSAPVKAAITAPVSAGVAATAAATLMSKSATTSAGPSANLGATSTPTGAGTRPPGLAAPRGDKADDLGLIWGVADKLEKKLNDQGIWHFDQIAAWTPAECLWIENNIDGMRGRILRDRWLEQCAKMAAGWRPATNIGERPKG